MELTLNPEMKINKLSIGTEKAPLLVIDNFINQADELVNHASQRNFVKNSPFYPGIRAEAPQRYQTLLIDDFKDTLIEFFQLQREQLSLQICHYSLVTTPAKELKLLQRIPHFDSLDKAGLASVHYLFKKNLGGTSFYRHKKTQFEYIDENRKLDYFRSLESENGTGNIPASGYINGDTALFEKIAQQDGVFNRIIFYRRNSLHSGSISEHFIPDNNPRTGRLSINSFID